MDLQGRRKNTMYYPILWRTEQRANSPTWTSSARCTSKSRQNEGLPPRWQCF